MFKKAKSVEQITVALTNMIAELEQAEAAATVNIIDTNQKISNLEEERKIHIDEAAKANSIRTNLQKLFN